MLRKPLVTAPPDLFCGLACCVPGITLGFLFRGQRRIAFGRFSLSERLGFLGLVVRLRGEFGGARACAASSAFRTFFVASRSAARAARASFTATLLRRCCSKAGSWRVARNFSSITFLTVAAFFRRSRRSGLLSCSFTLLGGNSRPRHIYGLL